MMEGPEMVTDTCQEVVSTNVARAFRRLHQVCHHAASRRGGGLSSTFARSGPFPVRDVGTSARGQPTALRRGRSKEVARAGCPLWHAPPPPVR